MHIANDLKAIFPACSKMDFLNGTVDINESNQSAKVKKITFTNADFHFIDMTLIKNLLSFFNNCSSSEIFNKDCDGIISFEYQGKSYIFLSELKSSFDSCDIFKARKQIISSYIKINLLLNLLDNYSRSNYIFKGFIACLPPTDACKIQLDKMLLMNKGNKYKNEAEFVADLCISDSKICHYKRNECFELKDLPLGNNCLFDLLDFHYIDVPIGCCSVTVNVLDYI